nr:hypothetical protein JVH1_3892 [Rhodococcus sp. JVH1]
MLVARRAFRRRTPSLHTEVAEIGLLQSQWAVLHALFPRRAHPRRRAPILRAAQRKRT